ncbi:MAG: gamma carbonic anhydrase family protein [Alphaproteobacteria bacterium]|nr:gamma carbonic anhydrase family protein [Alphaproteobacteria bacterium]
MPKIIPYRGVTPKIHPTAFIAPGAVIIGDVEIGPESSVWFGCVIRGDVNRVRIGARTNIQDGTVIHVASGEQPARLGRGRIDANASSSDHVNPTGNAQVAHSKIPKDGYPTLIGDDVTVGHMALLHACIVESRGFVGMKSIVMDGAKIESNGMLATGALLTPGKVVGSGELWAGSPAKFWRRLTDDDIAQFDLRSGQYVRLGQDYLKERS